MLTFFFDGVPPSERQVTISDKGPVDANIQDGTTRLVEETAEPTIFVHEPWKDCSSLCHGKRQKGVFSREVGLTAQAPELCYKCHSDYTASEGWVHGPVAVGECLECHEHHKSNNRHLLKKPEPEVCYQCHDVRIVESAPEHSGKLSMGCTNCHEAHTGPDKRLLKVVKENNAK
jgi:predicted CXXCH cytochrome family protein